MLKQGIALLTLLFIVATIPVSCASPAMAANSGAKATTRKKQASVRKPRVSSPFIRGHFVITSKLKKNGYHSRRPLVVVVDKSSHKTHVLQLQKRGKKEEVVRVLTVSNAVGKHTSPTSPGRYVVAGKARYPVWTPPLSADPKQKPVPPYNKDSRNPLGLAAIYLNKWDLILHGTNAPWSIRKNVSRGCVRHSNRDIAILYGMVRRGTPVYVVNRFRGKVIQRNDFVKQAIYKASA